MSMTPAERAERLIWLAQQNPTACLQDLAHACERSESWAQKALAAAGITPPGVKISVVQSKKAAAAANTRQVNKLIADARNAGVTFERTHSLGVGGTGFFNALFPDESVRAIFESRIAEHAGRIFGLLFPAPTRSRPRRPKCEICNGGSGCRKRGASGIGHELPCPFCTHPCRSHYMGMRSQLRDFGYPPSVLDDPAWGTPDGCTHAYRDADGKPAPCPCPGWPPAPPKPARKTRRKKTIAVAVQLSLATPLGTGRGSESLNMEERRTIAPPLKLSVPDEDKKSLAEYADKPQNMTWEEYIWNNHERWLAEVNDDGECFLELEACPDIRIHVYGERFARLLPVACTHLETPLTSKDETKLDQLFSVMKVFDIPCREPEDFQLLLRLGEAGVRII